MFDTSIFSRLLSMLTTGITAVYAWFTDLLNSIFGSYMVFGFIIVGIMVLSWALRTLNVFNGGSLGSDSVKPMKAQLNQHPQYQKTLNDIYNYQNGGRFL